MTAPQKERAPLLNRMADASPTLPTRRNGVLSEVEKERRELIVSRMPSSVSFGYTVNEPTHDRSLIEQFQSNAAGFVVSSTKDEALIVTNRHVYQGSKKEGISLQIKSSKIGPDGTERDGITFQPQFVYESPDHDIAFYSVRAQDNPGIDLEKELPAAPLGTATDAKGGSEIVVFGSPMSLKGTTKVGHVTHDELIPIRTQFGKGRSDLFIQMDAHLLPGNSGGMIVSCKTGEVVGMGTMILGLSDGRGNLIETITDAATPVDFIKEELAKFQALRKEGKTTIISDSDFQIPDFPFETAV